MAQPGMSCESLGCQMSEIAQFSLNYGAMGPIQRFRCGQVQVLLALSPWHEANPRIHHQGGLSLVRCGEHHERWITLWITMCIRQWIRSTKFGDPCVKPNRSRTTRASRMSCHYLALCWPTSLMSNAFASGLVRYTRETPFRRPSPLTFRRWPGPALAIDPMSPVLASPTLQIVW